MTVSLKEALIRFSLGEPDQGREREEGILSANEATMERTHRFHIAGQPGCFRPDGLVSPCSRPLREAPWTRRWDRKSEIERRGQRANDNRRRVCPVGKQRFKLELFFFFRIYRTVRFQASGEDCSCETRREDFPDTVAGTANFPEQVEPRQARGVR
jgi:hypothetical protein